VKKHLAWGSIVVLLPLVSASIWLFASVGVAKDPTVGGFPALRSESVGSDGHGNTVL